MRNIRSVLLTVRNNKLDVSLAGGSEGHVIQTMPKEGVDLLRKIIYETTWGRL